MDLWDFPALSAAESPEEAVPAIEKLRQPDKSWMQETPLVCRLEDWHIDPSRRRYTISVEDVPFECLYLPGKGKKLYVMLSGGGAAFRMVPMFLRWKWKNYLKGHMLFIDDPMYYFHKGVAHVMWYYGEKEKSYLSLALKIEQKAMELLGVPAENVVHIGSSGGGYAALYLCNMLDNSSAIAFSPQLILKPWQYPGVYENFLKWGIDLGADDPLNRNRLRLTNQTSYFFICLNYDSKGDYEKQFRPFAQEHGIPVRYGLSQHGNFAVWIHATQYSNLHIANPERIGLLTIDYLLDKARSGANLNELRPASLAANEILREKYGYRQDAEKMTKARQAYGTQFFSLISQVVAEEWGKLINRPEYPAFCGEQTVELRPEIHDFWSNYYTSTRRDIRYQILYSDGKIYFRFLRLLSPLGESRNLWLERAERIAKEPDEKLSFYVSHKGGEWFVMGKLLQGDNQRELVRGFILRTMDLWRDDLPSE